MTVSRKGKRKIVVGGETFLWWIGDHQVEENIDLPPHLTCPVCIASINGDFCIRFAMGQRQAETRLEVLGKRFRRVPTNSATRR